MHDGLIRDLSKFSELYTDVHKENGTKTLSGLCTVSKMILLASSNTHDLILHNLAAKIKIFLTKQCSIVVY